MFDRAIEANIRWGECTGNKIKTDVALAEIYALSGRNKDAEKIITDVEAGESIGSNDYRGMALVFLALGDTGMAFKWLEKSYLNHEESLCSIGIDTKWEPVRSDPRFKDLLRKIGLAP